MDSQMALTIIVILAILVYVAELVWLFSAAQGQEADPFRVVSGAAPFFVAAAPVAVYKPDWVEGIGDAIERGINGIFRGGGRSSGPPRVPARLLINGEQQALTMPRMRLGRYPNNEIVIDHSTVSAYHAEIVERPDGRHEIIDKESRNGTRVNGALVRSQVLKDGDLVTLGGASLHYLGESISS